MMKVKSRFKPKIRNKIWSSIDRYSPEDGVIIDLFISFNLICHRKNSFKYFLYEKIW